ncbi:peptidase inhibitor family I36 protein [Streptomyces sp. NPDC102451]|uniref:peptidase inhibitor family I36 protein n=1 Tax=Streptomyces sp. NPDC102451 TaxID=3366177 RepID=UPI003822A093
MRVHRFTRAALTGSFLMAAFSFATVGPSYAAGKDGTLSAGEMGLYYNSNRGGAVFDLPSHGQDPDLGNDYFKGSLNGAGQRVANNTASYWNRTTDNSLLVYTGTNYTGTYGYVPAGYIGNASVTFKNTISSVSTAYIIG